MAFTAAFFTAADGVSVTGFAGTALGDADASSDFSGAGTAFDESVAVTGLLALSGDGDASAAVDFAGAGASLVEDAGLVGDDVFRTVVDFDVGFFDVVDFAAVDLTVVDLVGLVFFAVVDDFAAAVFARGACVDALAVVSPASADSGFAIVDDAGSDAATVCFSTAPDAAGLFALVAAFLAVAGVFFAADVAGFLAVDAVVFFAADAVVFFAADGDGFFAEAVVGFFAADAVLFFAGAFFATGFFGVADDADVTPSRAEAGASGTTVSGALAGWVASSPGGVSSEEEEGAEVTHEIYQVGLTTASSCRNCE